MPHFTGVTALSAVEGPVEVIEKEKACKWATRYRSVTGTGTVEIVEDEDGKQEGLEAIMAQHGAPDLTMFESANMKGMVILKLVITSLTGRSGSR